MYERGTHHKLGAGGDSGETAVAARGVGIAGQRASPGRFPLAPIHILVGASLQRPFLDRFLAERLGAHANYRIHMPGDFALVLGAPALVAGGRRALPPLADRVLLAQVAAALDGYFSPVADTGGFAEALYRLVRDLKGAGFDLSELDQALSGTTDAPAKASALAELLRAFEERRTAFDGPDDALQQADPSLLEGSSGLIVFGVLDPSQLLEELVADAAQHAPVDVYLPEAPGLGESPAGAWITRMEARRCNDVPSPGRSGTNVRCPHTADGLPVRGARLAQPDRARFDGARLVSGPDPAREVKAAARACLEWASEGIPFWRMAMAYRHAEEYRPVIEAVFAEAQVPWLLTCTRAHRSPSARSAAGRSPCWSCSTATSLDSR